MIKKWKLFLAPDIEKEEKWLTEMSDKGLQFVKYKPFVYYFEENPANSYIYQVDFQEANDDYFELYKDAGWEYVDSFMDNFHYFRAEKDKIGEQRIYTDPESLKSLYKRMLTFYGILFMVLIVSMLGTFANWKGLLLQKAVVVLLIGVAILYLFLFLSIYKKIKKYE